MPGVAAGVGRAVSFPGSTHGGKEESIFDFFPGLATQARANMNPLTAFSIRASSATSLLADTTAPPPQQPKPKQPPKNKADVASMSSGRSVIRDSAPASMLT